MVVLVRLNAVTAGSVKICAYRDVHAMTSRPSMIFAGRKNIASRVMVFLPDKKGTLTFGQIDTV